MVSHAVLQIHYHLQLFLCLFKHPPPVEATDSWCIAEAGRAATLQCPVTLIQYLVVYVELFGPREQCC